MEKMTDSEVLARLIYRAYIAPDPHAPLEADALLPFRAALDLYARTWRADELRDELRADELRDELRADELRDELRADELRDELRADELRDELRADELRDELRNEPLRIFPADLYPWPARGCAPADDRPDGADCCGDSCPVELPDDVPESDTAATPDLDGFEPVPLRAHDTHTHTPRGRLTAEA